MFGQPHPHEQAALWSSPSHFRGEMPFQRRAHCPISLAVSLRKESNVAVVIKALEQPRGRALLNRAGMKIRSLLGYHDVLKDFLGGGQPSETHPWTQGF